VISKETGPRVREMLEGVLGPGRDSLRGFESPRILAGGKTGTAQVAEKRRLLENQIHRVLSASPAMNPK